MRWAVLAGQQQKFAAMGAGDAVMVSPRRYRLVKRRPANVIPRYVIIGRQGINCCHQPQRGRAARHIEMVCAGLTADGHVEKARKRRRQNAG
jgi:hypothetical protein